MFGSTNTFGQSSSNPFGSQSGFGQNNNASSNPFAPKPFGSVTPFGSQTGDSNFGSTSTGLFGATQASSAPVFGVSSSPAFGSSITPAFGASSTPAFGSSSSSFGGSSAFGQKPAFGGFGSPTTQTTPFGSTFQQSQPAFGNSLFGSSTIPFGVSSQSAFSAPSNQAFGGLSSSTPAFGATNMQVFGSQTFGSTGNAFGVSSTAPVFGGPATRTPSFGGASNPSFSFGSTPAFSQSTSAFGISPTPFVAQTSLLGAQTTAPTFGSPGFGPSAIGGQRGGSRVATYAPTAEVDGGTGTHTPGKLVSISAMPVYKDKSHEELRWEDYQQGDKCGPSSGGQSTGATGFGTSNTQVSLFSSSSTFGQPSANQFPSATATNPFAPKTTPSFVTPGFGPASSPAFGTAGLATSSIAANPFGSSSIATPSIFGSSNPTSGASTSATLFGSPGSSAFGSSTSIFSSTSTPTFNSGLNFGNTPSSPLFQSTAPPVGQSSSFGSQIASSFGQSTAASLFSTPSTGGSFFSSSQSLLQTNSPMGGFGGQTVPSLSASFQPAQPSQGAFGVGNFGQIQGAGLSGFGALGTFAQSNIGQSSSSTQHTAVVQAAPISNPFGTLPAMPQMPIAHAGTSPSIQYGISSLPVVDNLAPARVTSFLTSRHLSQRRITLPARKYRPKNDGPKVSFFSDDEETPGKPKADALFIPRENPRALVIRPNLEQWSGRAAYGEKRSPSRDATQAHVNEDDDIKEQRSNNSPVQSIPKTTNGVHDGSIQKVGVGDSTYITLTGHRAGEAAIVYEHGADVEALMPKLRHSDYYTEPRIQELAAKERAAPGFCRCVKDFVVGRHGYGSIMFLGETDVRRLDLESLIQFNHREVIVYMDESKKPPVGQGLNKHAVVTLLNIKCFDKKTGSHHTQGPKIDKYKEMLRKKAEDQGTDFVSYDPINGEWKFKVNHFSAYRFGEEEDKKNVI